MAMELKGKVIQLLPLQSGMGRKGQWRKQEFILETQSQYPKKVCLSIWGDKIDQFGVNEGDDVSVAVDLESREYNGRWYTDVKAWKIEVQGSGNSGSNNSGIPEYAAPDFGPDDSKDNENDLPF